MAANPIELIWRSRNYAEPITVLPNGRTSDESDAPLRLDCRLFWGCNALLRSSERRRAYRDRHGDRGKLSHSCHGPRV